MIDSLKYLRSPTLKYKYIGIRKSEFVTKLNSFYHLNIPDYTSTSSPENITTQCTVQTVKQLDDISINQFMIQH